MPTQPILDDPLPPPPRPRVSLRTAMRQQGIDEHKIALVLNEQVDRLRRPNKRNDPGKKPAAEEKLILDVVKECVKIVDPAARSGAGADGPATILLNHQVPRPDYGDAGADVHCDAAAFDVER